MTTTSVSVFTSQLPTYAQNPKSKAMQNMAGGLTGGGFGNRISTRGSKFRFLSNGEEVAPPQSEIEVVIFAMAEHVQRLYYKGAFDPNTKEAPTCYSLNGKTPEDDSLEKQSSTCAVCPQNVKGSGRQGNTKACAYKKRAVMLDAANLGEAPWALDVNAMSMFGEQLPNQNLYSFKGYFEKLTAHNVDIAAIVTKLTFDDSASVPKVFFSPMRVLTKDEYDLVCTRMDDEEVGRMLKDMTNVAELDTPAVPAKPAAPAVASKPATTKAGVGGLMDEVDAAPTPPRRGFGAPKGNGQTAVQATAKPAGAPTKPVKLNLDELVSFDDEG